MKVFDLLHSLTATEKKMFDGVMNIHNREQVKNLYQYVCKTPRHQISNERMYEATYGRPYTKDKDYLMRNELRLLGNELKEMLIKLELEKELKNNSNTANYWYLKALRSRGMQEYYEWEYEKLYRKATDDLQFETCVNLSREEMLYWGESWSAHLDFEKIEDKENIYRENIRRYTGNLMRQADLNRALFTKLSRIIYSKKRNIEPFTTPTGQISLSTDDPYSQAMMHLAQAHVSVGPERESHLFKALEHLQHCDKPGIPIGRHLGGCYNALSLYYLEQDSRDVSKAAQYAEKAFDAVFPDGPNPSVIYGNYLRILSQAGLHDKAREVFEQFHGHFKNEPNYPIILSAYLEGEAAYGDPDKAMEKLPLINTKEGINYNTYKVILITAYLRKNLLDLAYTEINNTLQNARENNLSDDMENFFQLIRALIRLKMQSVAKRQDLSKLLAYLTAITPEMLAVIRRTIIFMWYHGEAEKVLMNHKIKLPEMHAE